MDTNHPFGDDLARLALMYMLPVRERTGRLLVIGEQRSRVAPDWSGEVEEVPHIAGLTPSNGERFDCIALGDDSLASCGHPEDRVLHQLAGMLKPCGLLIGSLPHGLSWRHALRKFRDGRRASLFRPWTASGLAEALRRAGLDAVETFYVVPTVHSPMALVGTSPAGARAYDRYSVELTRDLHTKPGYLLRRVASTLGLGLLTFDALFFWARKPC